MKRIFSRAVLAGATVAIGAGLINQSPAFGQAVAGGTDAIPAVTGPIAGSSSGNHAFGSAAFQATPMNLSKAGYTEDEYFLSGIANVYQYANPGNATDLSLRVLRSGPYSNRILVRKPTNPSKFSGNVVIELLNPTNLYDYALMWSQNYRHLIAAGDVWIGVTAAPSSIAALKAFNASRYAALSWANPDTGESQSSCPNLSSNGLSTLTTHASEFGFLWDILSQTRALIGSGSRSNPLYGYAVKKVIAEGFSADALDLTTYLASIAPNHPGAIFDGYIIAAGSGAGVPLNQCGTAPEAGDPRNILRSPVSAIMQLQTQTEYRVARTAVRDDADTPTDRYRLYEQAGSAHIVTEQYPTGPREADIHAAGQSTLREILATSCPATTSNFPTHSLYDSARWNMERWLTENRTPPHADRISAIGVAPVLVSQVDINANALGGVRAPELDVPTATYLPFTGLANFACVLAGQTVPFSQSRVDFYYGNKATYLFKYLGSLAALVKKDMVTPEDALEALTKANRDYPGSASNR